MTIYLIITQAYIIGKQVHALHARLMYEYVIKENSQDMYVPAEILSIIISKFSSKLFTNFFFFRLGEG